MSTTIHSPPRQRILVFGRRRIGKTSLIKHAARVAKAALGFVDLSTATNLREVEQFQVIVSTHDHEEADFLIRKCRRDNLPVRRIELLSAGNEGVRFNLRDR